MRWSPLSISFCFLVISLCADILLCAPVPASRTSLSAVSTALRATARIMGGASKNVASTAHVHHPPGPPPHQTHPHPHPPHHVAPSTSLGGHNVHNTAHPLTPTSSKPKLGTVANAARALLGSLQQHRAAHTSAPKPKKEKKPRKPRKINIKASSPVYTKNAEHASFSLVRHANDPKKWVAQRLPEGTITPKKAGDEADHVYEKQMLEKALQGHGKQWESLEKHHQLALQGIMNHPDNMVFIPKADNGSKGSRLKWATKKGHVWKPNAKRRPGTDGLMSAGAPIAAHTATKVDDYLVKHGISDRSVALPHLKTVYSKAGWIASDGTIPSLPATTPGPTTAAPPATTSGTPNTANTASTSHAPATKPVG